MKFSIIIPVYNVELYLRECLDSVINQTFVDWEAICVNDGSMDGSASILDEYALKDERIVVVAQPNSGTAAARNRGLKVASGDYIFFLDSDDWLESNALQSIADQLDGEDVLCFSGRRYFEELNDFHQADQLSERQYKSGMEYYNDNALRPRDFAFVCVVLRVYKRSFINKHQLYFYDDVSYEDNLWVPIALYYAGPVKVISDVLYVYRVRAGSKMSEVSLARKKDLLEVANRLASFFIPKQGFEKNVVYRAITHHYQSVFAYASKEEKTVIRWLCDWHSYRVVSRTKLRHRLNYWKNKLN